MSNVLITAGPARSKQLIMQGGRMPISFSTNAKLSSRAHQLSNDAIRECHEVAGLPQVANCMQIAIDTVLSGGVQFRDKTLEEMDRGDPMFQSMWQDVARRAMYSIFTVGFAAVQFTTEEDWEEFANNATSAIDDPNGTHAHPRSRKRQRVDTPPKTKPKSDAAMDADDDEDSEDETARRRKARQFVAKKRPSMMIPRVIDTTMVDIYIERSATGSAVWHLFESDPKEGTSFLALPERTKLMQNVVVFEDTRPLNIVDSAGNIRSRTMRLKPWIEWMATERHNYACATARAANPAIITQTAPELPSNAYSSVITAAPAGSSGNDVIRALSTTQINEYLDARVAARVDSARKASESRGYINAHSATNLGGPGSGVLPFTPRVDLPDGRRLVVQAMPREPSSVMEIFGWIEELLGITFGVPHGLYSNTLNTHRGNAAFSESDMLFQQFEKMHKRMMIDIIRTLACKQYREELVRTVLFTDLPLEEKRKHVLADVNLPGIPAEMKLREMWQEGILKSEAYAELLADANDLPITAFNKNALTPTDKQFQFEEKKMKAQFDNQTKTSAQEHTQTKEINTQQHKHAMALQEKSRQAQEANRAKRKATDVTNKRRKAVEQRRTQTANSK